MKLSGLHLLLSYQCTFECDHCFVWGSPWQSGTMTLETLRHVVQQAVDLGTVESIYFEGGEPFLYYAVLLEGARLARQQGFHVGVVSNSYWATTVDDAIAWLKPLVGLIDDLSISSDKYHYNEELSRQANNARAAADRLGIPIGLISIAQPQTIEAEFSFGQLQAGESSVMYRGRAAVKLIEHAPRYAWTQLVECPYENLREPGRVHIDPFGNVHVCQGIVIGNVLRTSLREICGAYDPDAHPIAGLLLNGGPVELVRRYKLEHEESYADACHLCYEARRALRSRFAEVLTPDQMYGVI